MCWADLVVLRVTAPREKVDQQDDQSQDEPGGGDWADDAEALQVELGVWFVGDEVLLQPVEGDVDVRDLVEQHRPECGLVLLQYVWCWVRERHDDDGGSDAGGSLTLLVTHLTARVTQPR